MVRSAYVGVRGPNLPSPLRPIVSSTPLRRSRRRPCCSRPAGPLPLSSIALLYRSPTEKLTEKWLPVDVSTAVVSATRPPTAPRPVRLPATIAAKKATSLATALRRQRPRPAIVAVRKGTSLGNARKIRTPHPATTAPSMPTTTQAPSAIGAARSVTLPALAPRLLAALLGMAVITMQASVEARRGLATLAGVSATSRETASRAANVTTAQALDTFPRIAPSPSGGRVTPAAPRGIFHATARTTPRRLQRPRVLRCLRVVSLHISCSPTRVLGLVLHHVVRV
ncbi:hypothetical protein BD414DRAFT_85589 [Trametes punicea]|nr:hypothetical protein BD414DRAFT_85589 [Trametes punicea]